MTELPNVNLHSPGAARIIRRIIAEKRAGAPDAMVIRYVITEALHLIMVHEGTAADCMPCHAAMNRIVHEMRTPADWTGAAIVASEGGRPLLYDPDRVMGERP